MDSGRAKWKGSGVMQTQRHLPGDAVKKSSGTIPVRRIGASHLCITARSRSGPTVEQLISEYDRHMDQVCGFSVSTRRLRRYCCRHLLRWRYGTRPIHLPQLSAKDLAEFVRTRAPDLSPGSLHMFIVSLRSFCRFLEFSGCIRIGLSGALPRVPTPPSAQPPKTLKLEEWRRFLSGFPWTTAATPHSCSSWEPAMDQSLVTLAAGSVLIYRSASRPNSRAKEYSVFFPPAADPSLPRGG
jgi:hypothetical protein